MSANSILCRFQKYHAPGWLHAPIGSSSGAYGDNPPSLLDNITAEAGMPSGGVIRGLIGPHAGYRFSGPAAGAAYAELEEGLVKAAEAGRPIQRVLVMGPSHHVYINGCAVSGAITLETPVGALSVDT